MRFRILLAFSALAAGSAAYSQTPTLPPLPVERPYFALYDEFFYRVTWLDNLGDQFNAKQKDGSVPRSLIRREARLTEDEEAALKRVAKTWNLAHAASVAELRRLAVVAQPAERRAQALAIRSQYESKVLECVDDLRRSLRPATFKLLDVYVRRTATKNTPAAPFTLK